MQLAARAETVQVQPTVTGPLSLDLRPPSGAGVCISRSTNGTGRLDSRASRRRRHAAGLGL